MIAAGAQEVPALEFAIERVEPLPAAAPTLRIWLQIDAGERVLRSLALNARVQIQAPLRRYTADEAQRLGELFGAVEDWSRSLAPVPWVQSALHLGPFAGTTTAELRVPCTYDFEVAAAKYLAALDDGTVPLEVLFSGTLSWNDGDGRVQTAMIPWDRDASFRMPVAVWQEAMRMAFGDSAWLRLHRDVLKRLQAYRSQQGLTSWDDVLDELLAERER